MAFCLGFGMFLERFDASGLLLAWFYATAEPEIHVLEASGPAKSPGRAAPGLAGRPGGQRHEQLPRRDAVVGQDGSDGHRTALLTPRRPCDT